MTYNRDHLPTTLLTPPIPAPHPNIEATWNRDWTIYAIAVNWRPSERGSEWGKYQAIARWLTEITGEEQLSRERIRQIVTRVHWMLRPYMRWTDEIIEASLRA